MAAFCGACGKPVVGDVKFCGGCGAPTSSSNAAQATPPAAPSPVINAAPAAAGTSALKIIVILVLIAGAGLAVVGTGAYLYGRKKIAQYQKDNGISGDASSMSGLQAAAAAHHARTHGSGSAASWDSQKTLQTSAEVDDGYPRGESEEDRAMKAVDAT
jgi:hypothetical protein